VGAGPHAQEGERIGRYKLLQQIGEGGCGIVYMAEQEEPVRRRVALKIIKLGMDTKQVIARFEAERQALAMMDHPNIARVLDAGATETGRPFFVMELVRGIRITDYCDQHALPTTERLKLFTQVCRAVQHAHQKGIIHRDIKPSNILVASNDGVPVPKVIDFGIAKATQGRLTDQTVFTAFEQFIGTPAYMSPEQAELTMLDVDTRTDIYSLGVLLYELLTGRTPFDSNKLLAAGLDAMRRTIREQEPERPSTCLSTLMAGDLTTTAKQRHTEPVRLIHLLRGDLDWIVMKCLEKDRARRYETANGLALDIERHLANEPVMARPPGRLYRIEKLVRRHKLAVAAAAAVAGALVTGLSIAIWEFSKEKEARREADKAGASEAVQRQKAEAGEKKAQVEAGKSQQVARFLEEMLKGVGPKVALGRDTQLLQEILDNTAERTAKDLKDQPEVAAELLATIGAAYLELFNLTKAEAMHREALRLRRSIGGETNPAVASSLNDLARVLIIGRGPEELKQAEAMSRQALEIWKHCTGAESEQAAFSMYLIASAVNNLDKALEAEAIYRDCLAIRRKLFGNDHKDVASCLDNLGLALLSQNKTAQAEEYIREAMAIQKRLFGEEHPDIADSLFNLGRVYERQNKLTEAEKLFRDGLAMREKLMGRAHPQVQVSLRYLSGVLDKEGKEVEAEATWDKADSLAQEGADRGDPQMQAYTAWRMATDPEPKRRDGPNALRYAEQAVGASGRTNVWYLSTLAAAYAELGQFTNAVRAQQEGIDLLQNPGDKAYLSRRRNIYASGFAYRDDALLVFSIKSALAGGRFEDAERLARKCLVLRERQDPDDWRSFLIRSVLGAALVGQKKYGEETEKMLLSGYTGMKEREQRGREPSEMRGRLKDAAQQLVQLYEARGQSDKAAEWKQKLAASD
jgi:tRNA A-37 threonylcarbamoyl transferase component Bud32